MDKRARATILGQFVDESLGLLEQAFEDRGAGFA